MAIKLTSTKEAAVLHGVKVGVYGQAGAGKTSLAKSLGENTVIISAEAGLLSLRDVDVPVLQVTTIEQVHEAYTYLTTDQEGQAFTAVMLDSASEIAEVVLGAEKKGTSDPRRAYGAMQDQMMDLLRAFRDLPGRDVLMTFKLERVKDEMTGAMLYGPMMPGKQLAQQVPYLFDELFALRVEQDQEANWGRYLQTAPDFQYQAKDRSGALSPFELPDMSAVFKKIRG